MRYGGFEPIPVDEVDGGEDFLMIVTDTPDGVDVWRLEPGDTSEPGEVR